MPTLTINNTVCEYPEGTTYGEIAAKYREEYAHRIALVRLNGKIRELMHTVERDGTLEFLTLADSAGHKAYVRTAIMLMIKAFRDELNIKDHTVLKVEFTVGAGVLVGLGFPASFTDVYNTTFSWTQIGDATKISEYIRLGLTANE